MNYSYCSFHIIHTVVCYYNSTGLFIFPNNIILKYYSTVHWDVDSGECVKEIPLSLEFSGASFFTQSSIVSRKSLGNVPVTSIYVINNSN